MKFRGNVEARPTDNPYTVLDFANKHGLTAKAAEILIYANGPSRVACDAAARSFVTAVGERMKQWQRDKD